MNKKVIFIKWPSCAWKSTIVKSILEKHEELFHINKDRIKWLISNYSNQNQHHLSMLDDMLVSMTKIALNNWMNVIIEWQSKLYTLLESYLSENDIEILLIYIEAPYDILEKRFYERLRDVELNWWRVANKSIDRFREIYDEYISEKKENILTLDTSILSKDEAINKAIKYINL